AAHRRSYARRTGAERGFATAKDPATNDNQPRLVPPHGPDAAHAVRSDAARRPQPAHPRRMARLAERKRTPCRRRPPAQPQPLPPRVPPPVPPRHAATTPVHKTSSLAAIGTPSPHYRTRRTSRLNGNPHTGRLPGFVLLLRKHGLH